MITIKQWNRLSLETKKLYIKSYYIDAEIGVEGRNILLLNINVMDQYLTYAKEFLARDMRVGSRYLVDKVRFESPICDSDRTFKINNNLSKYLSRITMAIFPEFNGFFEKRAIK